MLQALIDEEPGAREGHGAAEALQGRHRRRPQVARSRSTGPTSSPSRTTTAYDQKDATGFIKLNALRLKIRSMSGDERAEHGEEAKALGRPLRRRAPTELVEAFTASIPFDRRLLYQYDIARQRRPRAHAGPRGIIAEGRRRGDRRRAGGDPRGDRDRGSSPSTRRRGHPHGRRAAASPSWPARPAASSTPAAAATTRSPPTCACTSRDALRRGRPGSSSAPAGAASTGPRSAGDAYLPGYTHLQRAQPVLLAHHLLAHGWALLAATSTGCATPAARVDVSPLGAGALAGSSLPARPRRRGRRPRLRRPASRTASTPCRDRDFVAEALFAAHRCGDAPLAARRGDRPVDDRRVRLRSPRRRLRHRLVDAAAEEEPRHRRARRGARPAGSSATSPASSPR